MVRSLAVVRAGKLVRFKKTAFFPCRCSVLDVACRRFEGGETFIFERLAS